MNDRWELNLSLADWPPSGTIPSFSLRYPRFLSVTRGYAHSALFEGSQELAMILVFPSSSLSFRMNGYPRQTRELSFTPFLQIARNPHEDPELLPARFSIFPIRPSSSLAA